MAALRVKTIQQLDNLLSDINESGVYSEQIDPMRQIDPMGREALEKMEIPTIVATKDTQMLNLNLAGTHARPRADPRALAVQGTPSTCATSFSTVTSSRT